MEIGHTIRVVSWTIEISILGLIKAKSDFCGFIGMIMMPDDYDGRTEWNVNEDIGGRIEAPGKGSISVNMHNHVNPSNTICIQYAHAYYSHNMRALCILCYVLCKSNT